MVRQGLRLDAMADDDRVELRDASTISLGSIGRVRLTTTEGIEQRAMAPPRLHRLTLAMGALSTAVLMLATFAVFRPMPDVVVQRAPIVDGTMAQSEGSPERVVARAHTKPVAAAVDRKPEPEPEPEPVAEAEPEASPRVASKPSRGSTSKPRASQPAKPTPPVAAAQPIPAPARDTLSVDCILDPASCDRGATKPSERPRTEPVASDVPDKLSTAQIRDALAEPKSAAKRCATTPGGSGLVKVKLSIASNGAVVDADAIEGYAGTALGACVAETLGRAKFPAFAQPRMGIVYSVRL